MHLSPAQYVIYIFGGVRATARALGKHPTTISKWQNHKTKTGVKGRIPSSAQRLILEVANELNLNITSDHLIYGKTVELDDGL